ncbi:pitrilysin family protein [Thiomicrorhabdus sp. ZW0627]|uniref:M16 family metallopeptidase n=1 Tax=Thiomicrorhabdus sp. ZW0627 TaxID=3039774 RepID=UPI002436848B|nr:pitrilysin family protein [Thiomicrorhabdus sp. ZW0627]MDG6773927.1 pitrilysin family protein [Thiomicrorhabdus sp. ZW0627]
MKRFTVLLIVCFGTLLLSVQASASVEIKTWHTSQGSKVMYVHSPELPMLDIEVAFDAGSARDGEKWGLASMTSALIGTQTPNLSEKQISRKTNELGAKINGGVDRDMANFSLRTLTRESIFKPALELFRESLTQSVFNPEIFNRERQRLLVALKQQQMDPSEIARNEFWKQLYGNHPYAHPVSGSIETVKALKLEDLQDFYKRYIVAANATISIVGDVSLKEAKEISENLMKSLPKGQKPAALPEPENLKTAQRSVIKFDSSQTYFRQGQIGVERGDPDYYALFLGNHLLGGSGFGSLLMEEVREKRGLVYSVGSGFAPMRVAGPWLSYLSTKNQSANEAEKVVVDTLKAFMKSIDDKHFQAIKDNLIGGFPLRIDSNAKIVGYISMIGFYDLPLDYLDQFPKIIESLSKEDVLKAWKKHIHPDKMVTVMVGNPA